MPTLQIEHGVRDYDEWKKAFDGDPVGPKRAVSAATASRDPSTIRAS